MILQSTGIARIETERDTRMERKTKKEILKAALRECQGNTQTAFEMLANTIGRTDSTDRLIWSSNVHGKRQPLPLHDQHVACRAELARYAKQMGFAATVPNGDDAADTDAGADEASGEACPDTEAASAASADDARSSEAEAKAKAENLSELSDAANAAEAEAKAKLSEAREAVKEAEGDDFDAAMEAAAEAMAEAQAAEAEAAKAEQEALEAEAEAEQAAEATAEAEAEEQAEAEQERPNEARRWITECQRLREFVRGRNNFDPMESNRIEAPGLHAIAEGAPVDALLTSLTATWSDELKGQANITAFDFMQHGNGTPGQHAAAEYVLALMKANIPVWLHGPAGTGKSTLARYAAEALGVDYYEVNLAGSLPSSVKGRDRLKEFVTSEFCTAYANGGVMCLEEFDAAPPQTAVAINNAIANGHFHNDASGEVIIRHPDFRVVATANTLGMGATKEFQRNKIDGATLDRFRLGRVMIDRDEALADTIINAALTELDFGFQIGATR